MVNIVYPPGQFESREHYLEYFLVTEWRKPESQANAIEQAWVIQASLKEYMMWLIFNLSLLWNLYNWLCIRQIQHPPKNHEFIPEQVKLYLPKILGQIAYHINYMKTAINLLWELGKSDSSDKSRPTDHAHHVLMDLSKQRYGRIAAYYDTYLQCVEMWCTEVDAFERGFTPLHIIPSFLARDGSEGYYFSQTQSIHMQPFYVLPEPMRDIRKRAIHLLATIGQMNERPKLQYYAVQQGTIRGTSGK